MNKFSCVFLIAALSFISFDASARGGGREHSSHSPKPSVQNYRPKTVYVHPYMKRDGTVVQSYRRSTPK